MNRSVEWVKKKKPVQKGPRYRLKPPATFYLVTVRVDPSIKESIPLPSCADDAFATADLSLPKRVDVPDSAPPKDSHTDPNVFLVTAPNEATVANVVELLSYKCGGLPRPPNHYCLRQCFANFAPNDAEPVLFGEEEAMKNALTAIPYHLSLDVAKHVVRQEALVKVLEPKARAELESRMRRGWSHFVSYFELLGKLNSLYMFHMSRELDARGKIGLVERFDFFDVSEGAVFQEQAAERVCLRAEEDNARNALQLVLNAQLLHYAFLEESFGRSSEERRELNVEFQHTLRECSLFEELCRRQAEVLALKQHWLEVAEVTVRGLYTQSRIAVEVHVANELGKDSNELSTPSVSAMAKSIFQPGVVLGDKYKSALP